MMISWQSMQTGLHTCLTARLLRQRKTNDFEVNKMDKKILFGTIGLLMILVLAAAVSGARQGPFVSAEVLKYEPSPVEPGNIMEVWVSVTNEGTTSENFEIEFVPEFPFELGPGEDEMKTLAALPQGENAIIKFLIYVDPKAPIADKDIKFNYKYSAVPNWIQLKSPISIKTTGAILNIESYKTSPEVAKPGDVINVELFFRNSGFLDVRDIDVTLNIEDSGFSTIGSGNTMRIGFISAGGTASIKFSMIADTSAEIKVHSIPVALKFKDNRGSSYTQDTRFSLVMAAEPELSAVVDSTTISSEGQPGTITLKVINKGIMDLKYLNMRLASTDQYDVLSASNEAYIGNLDSDDFETVDFIIKPKSKNVQLWAIVEFKDPYNKEYEKQFYLPLRVFSPSELGKGGSVVPYLIGAVVVLVVIGYIYYRYKKRRK
jgi:hypothetical protein